MFRFVVLYLRAMRFAPGLAYLFDCLLLSLSSLTKPQVIAAIDEIERTLLSWPGVTRGHHRFGGVEYRLGGHEIGHLHGNGLLDIPLTKTLREQLVADGRAQPHHIYATSGWISYYIRGTNDLDGALALLRLAYERRRSA